MKWNLKNWFGILFKNSNKIWWKKSKLKLYLKINLIWNHMKKIIKIAMQLTSMLGFSNKSWTISVSSCSTAKCNGLIEKNQDKTLFKQIIKIL